MSHHREQWSAPARMLTLVVLLPAAMAALVVGCGDDNGESPTPAATATATRDATTEFKAQAKAAVSKLQREANTLLTDMQAAQQTQSDPKWPGVLTADADLVTAAASAVKALVPAPGTPPALATGLQSAATRLAEGADLLKRSVQGGDQALGAEAFAALGEGLGALQQLSPQLD